MSGASEQLLTESSASAQIVVLTWGSSQRDLEAVERILSQVCQAYRKDGGKVVVVISQREKLEMEAMYRSATTLCQ